MVSRPALAPSRRFAGPWVSQLEALPGGTTGAIVLAVVGIVLAVGAGALPPIPAVVLLIGLPTAILALTKPRVALVLLVFSFPLSGWTSIAVGSFSISSTDVVVALLLLGFLLRGVAEKRIVASSPLIRKIFLPVVTGCECPRRVSCTFACLAMAAST